MTASIRNAWVSITADSISDVPRWEGCPGLFTARLDIEAAAALAVIVLLLAGAVTLQQAYRSINWSVLFLLAAFVPVGLAIINTGTAAFLAQNLLRIGEIAPWLVLSLVYLATSVLNQMISNNAAAIIIAPVAITVADVLGVDSRPFIVTVCFAASIRRSLQLPAREPEPLAHAPPETLELIAESA